MRNNDKTLQTDTKPKMLFNSDGFEFLIKFMTVLFKIIGMGLVAVLNILPILLSNSSKKESSVYYDERDDVYRKL